MSTIRTSALGPVTGSNTATIVDPATPTNGVATLNPLVASQIYTLSGTSTTITGIPSWVRRITVSIHAAQIASSGSMCLQVGSGSLASSGYYGAGGYVYSGTSYPISNGFTNGFPGPYNLGSSNIVYGTYTIIYLGSYKYVCTSMFGQSDYGIVHMGASGITLSGVLDRIALNTAQQNINYSAGTATVLYE